MTFDVVTIMKFNKHLTAISKHLNRTKAIPYNNIFEPPQKIVLKFIRKENKSK